MTDFEISKKYHQNRHGLYKRTYNKGKLEADIRIGRIYIQQMKIVNDDLGEFEKVFSINIKTRFSIK